MIKIATRRPLILSEYIHEYNYGHLSPEYRHQFKTVSILESSY